MVKHRQLARQVGAFGEFASESSMDLDSMIFSTGSTFIFGSWIYEADHNGKLQGRLLEDSNHHEDYSILATMIDQITGRFALLVMSDSTQVLWLCVSNLNSGSTSEIESYLSSFGKPSSFPMGLKNAALAYQEYNSEYTQSLSKKSSHFSFGLHNMATSYQTRPEGFLDPVLRMPLKGAQEGLVLTITSQDCIVHWPGSVPEGNSTRLVDATTTTILPYQEGDSICDLETSTEVINSSDSTEINDDDRTTHAREVFMIRRPRSPLIPPRSTRRQVFR